MKPLRALAGSLLIAAITAASLSAQSAGSSPLKQEVESLHRAMVTAFKQDPAGVSRYYTDDATIMGGGARSVGREQVSTYWSSSPRDVEWTLEVIELGGDAQSPWVRGRSTLSDAGGRRFATDYVGILKRGADGQLRFYIDIYTMVGGAVRTSGAER